MGAGKWTRVEAGMARPRAESAKPNEVKGKARADVQASPSTRISAHNRHHALSGQTASIRWQDACATGWYRDDQSDPYGKLGTAVAFAAGLPAGAPA